MVFESGVDIDAVRRSLNQISVGALSDAAIQQAIDRAEVVVGDAATADAAPAAKRVAVIDTAAYRAVMSSGASFTERKEALDLTAEINVEAWTDGLREEMEESLNRISDANQPSLYTFGDRRQRRSADRHDYTRGL